MTRPRLLDLFCCEGGAAVGYYGAGFDVTGVDIRPISRYPFRFVRGDALDYVAEHGRDFDAIHASPPCQAHSALRHVHDDDVDSMLFPLPTHPDLVAPTRAALIATGRPYIIENVVGAPLLDPVTLCGTMFALGTITRTGWRELRRHRLFESNVDLAPPRRCRHYDPVIGVYGEGGPGDHERRKANGRRGAYSGTVDECRAAMGMPWASRNGVSQGIPPAYTRHLGEQLRSYVDGTVVRTNLAVDDWGPGSGRDGQREQQVQGGDGHPVPAVESDCR